MREIFCVIVNRWGNSFYSNTFGVFDTWLKNYTQHSISKGFQRTIITIFNITSKSLSISPRLWRNFLGALFYHLSSISRVLSKKRDKTVAILRLLSYF